jgi:hypothetical protein
LFKWIVSRKFAMLLLVSLESYKYSTPFLVHQFLKISSFSYRKFDYKMFSGDFLLSPFSVNDSCYSSDGRRISQHFVHCWQIRAIFIWNILCFAELRGKILPVQIRAQTRNHIWVFCIHGSLFLSTGHQCWTSSNRTFDMKTRIFLKM